ncbi:hypothetical protein [Asticcacaulis excentricus]|uniref:Uncharacterized protein n=1 Tax=Asticcacaulis excentricus (strain ATCC 15261 / DSM 4724 / KCTC 12464 / NCIMB 9791 / VKM B-1370 / CB 48) TaxID=573065 RepID=E8RMZ2_ASTEC|nr:hypothetical protein [Asticcacaulis excentricus]ADU11755.1 hypothetical protein Astex_0051 [Asticcacaulis excentricus CB 48]
MSGDIVSLTVVQTDYTPFLLSLFAGWIVLFVGVLIRGRRFAFFALPLGIAIPLAHLALAGLWKSLLVFEIVAWNATYWLIPGLMVSGLGLLIRRVSANT